VKEWLHHVDAAHERRVPAVEPVQRAAGLYGDVGTFATSAMFVEEDEKTRSAAPSFPIGSYLLANDHNGRVRTFAREFRMTVRQLVERFGGRQDASRLVALLERRQERKWDRAARDVDRRRARRQPNPSTTPAEARIEVQGVRLAATTRRAAKGSSCSRKRASTSSRSSPRWSVTGEDAWGTDCPGMIALGDIKQLQLGEKRGMQAIEKSINPPMVGPSGDAQPR
jgi:hypothetical protein